jgi:hypothetical protein
MDQPSGYVLPGLREGRYLTIQAQYEEWRESPEGKLAYSLCRDAALTLKDRGFKHFGIAAIWERARYEAAIQTGPKQAFKLNNNWRSRIARELMNNEIELVGFFETRELRAA